MAPRKKNKSLKVLFYTVLGIFLFLVLAQIATNIYLKVIFKKNIDSLKKEISAYRIEYESITANILDSSITLKNLRLIPNHKFPGLERESSEESRSFRFELPVLKITGIQWFSALLYHSLRIKNIRIENGKLKIISNESSANNRSVFKAKRDIIVLSSFPFTRINVEEIKIKNFSFESAKSGLDTAKKKIYNFSLRFTDSKINIKKSENHEDQVTIESFRTNMEDLEVLFPGKMYYLRIKKMIVSEPLSRIKIRSLKLIPAYKKYIFSRKKRYRISRIYWETDQLNFFNVRFKDLINKKFFKADLLDITGSRIHFFRDRRLMRRQHLMPKKFPQEVFRELKFHLGIKKIKIKDGYISYEEHQTGFRTPGKIDFKDVDIVAVNISNFPDTVRPELQLSVKLSSLFLGKSVFNARFISPIHNKNNSFYFSGSLDKMPIAYLNPILKNSFLKVESGAVKKMIFNIWGNRYLARGTLKFYYNDLRVSLMKRRNRIKRDGAGSFIANQFLKNDNPRRGKSFRIGYIYHVRSPYESILKLIWKSFLSGVKSSVGL